MNDINSSNYKIALFMDAINDNGLEPAYVVFNHKGYELNDLHYHNSLDWLIPVIEKIEHERGNIISSRNYASLFTQNPADALGSYGKNRLDAIYNLILLYIEQDDRLKSILKELNEGGTA